MKANQLARKNKKLKKRVHPYASQLKEIRVSWKKNPSVIKNMIQDMVEKRGKMIERPYIIEFVVRFLGIHQEKIKNVDYDLWRDVLTWAIRQQVQYIVDVYSWFRIEDYKVKYWATQDMHLNYLDHRIKVISRALNMNIGNSKFQRSKIEMMRLLKKGIYPDTSVYDPFWVGRILAIIQYAEFLKAEKTKLLEPKSITTIKVPVELKKDQMTHTDQLQVSFPASFFKFIQRDLVKEELRSVRVPMPASPNELKLFTRAETSELMQISLPTLDEMTKNGKIKCHRIGDTNLKRYQWKDIQAALVEIESRYTGKKNLRYK